ncbi:MAG TPA: hypothetical protein VLH84_00340 [Patescibacteria group bacterium]|nr:hypothetical protein [Patescibacteria group bacterium]
MDKEDIKALNSARVTAGWSYLGAIVPLVGWILAGISLSHLGSIEAETSKAKRRIKSVKKLAFGGIVLSTIVALLYGSGAYLNARHNNQLAVQAKANAIKSCEAQVVSINNRIFSVNTKYQAANASILDSFQNEGNTSDCKKNTSSAVSTAQAGYNTAVNAANARCISAATDAFNNTEKINAISTTTDSSGQTIYHFSTVAILTQMQEQFNTDKANCNSQFPSS